MTTTGKCPQCGAEMTETAEGLCPACLLKRGMATKTSAGSSGNVPEIEEVAKRFPQLEIIELLGAGGMGVVYKARQPQLDRLVALKILPAEAGRDPAFAERFAREARALAKLNHPNIVTVHEFGEANGLFYLIMEYVDGANLRQMERSGKLTAAEALAIVPKICDALQYAHDEGIVHRDIKPENILVDKKGRVKIADFGLAKLLGKAPTEYTLTGSQQAMGTPHYMAPEQMEKPLSVDHRADIYSLGVVFYEMLTGELPIGRFQPPSAKVHVDVRLDEVVLRSMEHDVERRYQHVSEVKTDVESITAFVPVGVPTLVGAGQKPPEGGTPTPVDAIRRQVKGPAIGLLATSIFIWVMVLIISVVAVGVILFATHPAGQMKTIALPVGAGMFMLTLVATVIMVGAQKMKRLESYGWAMTASILATVGGGIGMPFGIWALVVLLRPEVKAAFAMAAPVGVPTSVGAGAEPPKGGTPTGMSPLKIVLIVLGCLAAIPVVIGLLLVALYWRTPSRTRPPGPNVMLKEFTRTDPVISKDFVPWGEGWMVNCATGQTYRLFEIVNPDAEACTLTYRVGLRLENLEGGRVYPEMWCRLPGRGEFFSKGLTRSATGTNDWSSYEILFRLKKGEKPDLIRLNLFVKATGILFKKAVTGKVWIKDVELAKAKAEEILVSWRALRYANARHVIPQD